MEVLFSSPHGDFSFSILFSMTIGLVDLFSSPHGDFSFSIIGQKKRNYNTAWFSSPHGDFSFSIITKQLMQYQKSFRPLTGISLFLLAYMVLCQDLVQVKMRNFYPF